MLLRLPMLAHGVPRRRASEALGARRSISGGLQQVKRSIMSVLPAPLPRSPPARIGTVVRLPKFSGVHAGAIQASGCPCEGDPATARTPWGRQMSLRSGFLSAWPSSYRSTCSAGSTASGHRGLSSMPRRSSRPHAGTMPAVSSSPSAPETMRCTSIRVAGPATPTSRAAGGTPPATSTSPDYRSVSTVTSMDHPARCAECSALSSTIGLPPRSLGSKPHPGLRATSASPATVSGTAVSRPTSRRNLPSCSRVRRERGRLRRELRPRGWRACPAPVPRDFPSLLSAG